MNTYARANAGDYDSKLQCPPRPERPAILRTPVGQLSREELHQAADAKDEWVEAMLAYRESERLASQDQAALIAKMQADLEAEFGTAGNPKAGLLWSKAWAAGHAGGASEICSHYADLAELVVS